MTPASAPFDQLLERYVFKVTSHQIELADPAMQTSLIDFWQTVSENVVSSEPATGLSPTQPTEWAAVLQEPIDWRSVNRRWVQEIIRKRSQSHNTYLTRLEQAMETTSVHLRALHDSPLSEPTRTRLMTHYRHLLQMYGQQLTRAQHIQQLYVARLNAGMP